jgi:glycine C-acetyltransferase
MSYSTAIRAALQGELEGIRAAGLLKEERTIHSAQDAWIQVEFPEGAPPKKVVNLCANNYLGLSSHPEVGGAAPPGRGSSAARRTSTGSWKRS